MATDKVFTIVGVSTLDGEMKMRFANDIMRVKVLAKHGHTDITLVELESAMDKLAAAKFVKGLDEFAAPEIQATIDDYIERNTPKEKKVKAEKVAKPKKDKVEKAAEAAAASVTDEADVAAARELAAELDDAPY